MEPAVTTAPRRSVSSLSSPRSAEVEASRIATATSTPGPEVLESGQAIRDVYHEDGDEVYERHSPRRKIAIVVVMSFCAFLPLVSGTSVLAATPEVAHEYQSTGTVINASNAGYMVFMGISCLVWGPMSQVFGRRPIIVLTAVLFLLLSVATALAPNLAAFFVFRALSAFEGTAFLLLGSACIGDIYRPTDRGTAIGWFMSGTHTGPAFGPFLGGIIVTYSSWRTIFWLQTALAGAAALGVFFLVPETIHGKKMDDLARLSRGAKARAVLSMANPIRPLRLFRYPNMALVAVASSSLMWNMYSLLTPIRYVLNPRFHLQTPLLSGLFYLAPGCGYVLGTFIGGRWADYTVRHWFEKRGRVRVPEDRLRSSLPFIGVVVPGSMLVYGWAVDRAVGGVPVPVMAMFVQGVAQLFCSPSLNTYCLDVLSDRGVEATAANYFVRYLASCVGTAVVLPAVQGVGIGWFCTMTALFVLVTALGIMATIRWGEHWREQTSRRLETRKREHE